MDVTWDGITQQHTVEKRQLQVRYEIADAAKSFSWIKLLELLSANSTLVNSSRVGGRSRFAPLHQAALGGAPIEVVQKLVKMGAWRTLQNAEGERSLDIAVLSGHQHLLRALEPVYVSTIPLGILLKIQHQFHELIRTRVSKLVAEHALRLPELEPMLELVKPEMWFPVPGMYGGFSYKLNVEIRPSLTVESWCRVDGGSEQTHTVSASGATLEEEGFD